MPKRRKHISHSKPQTSVHPSISRSSHSHNNDSPQEQAPQKSVNDLLQHLRISQAPSVVPTESRSDVNPKTLHPSVSSILQIPQTPPPRPRPGMRPFATPGRRRPPGPAPPRSWLENSGIHAPPHARRAPSTQRSLDSQERPNLESLTPLPDTHLPHPRSLQHLTLLHLAQNWDFHVEYDQYYLATLPVRYKQALLTYIAKHSPHGITLHGLQTLFLASGSLPSATGAEGLTHLDLSGSIGRSLSLLELKKFITTTFHIPTSTSTPSTLSLDSWEEEEEDNTNADIPSLSPTPPPPPPTHLSLSHPSPLTPSPWRSLLTLILPLLPTLTALSLASWPSPSLHPNSRTAYLTHPSSSFASIPLSPTPFYAHTLDFDFSGSASVLRHLARLTYCLQHLDLSGCHAWLPALAWRESGGGGGGIEWAGAWSGLRTVRVAQACGVPEALLEEEHDGPWRALLAFDESREEGDVRKARQARELRAWCAKEVEVEEIGRRVREEGEEGPSGPVNGVSWEDIEAEWLDGRRTGGPRMMGWEKGQMRRKGGCRVHFDRGWDGWWIKECVGVYKAMYAGGR
ncbi:MAG: hypothetical protein Q9208_001559 [Pyrenodesmia sp. 3 TL-2023]